VTAVTGLVGRIIGGEQTPRASGAQNPEDAIQDATGIAPRATGLGGCFRDEGLYDGPLLVGEVHENYEI
jgi:hypothetical protein